MHSLRRVPTQRSPAQHGLYIEQMEPIARQDGHGLGITVRTSFLFPTAANTGSGTARIIPFMELVIFCSFSSKEYASDKANKAVRATMTIVAVAFMICYGSLYITITRDVIDISLLVLDALFILVFRQ